MPRPRIRAALMLLVAVPAFSVALAGCSSQAVAGWTFTPTQPVTAPPATPSAAASGGSSSQAPSAATIDLTAQGIAFKETSLDAPAGKPFTIHFSNQDSGLPHNVAIFQGTDTSGTPQFKGDLVTGVATKDYSVPALSAGTYTFICQVHPTMTGTITVK